MTANILWCSTPRSRSVQNRRRTLVVVEGQFRWPARNLRPFGRSDWGQQTDAVVIRGVGQFSEIAVPRKHPVPEPGHTTGRSPPFLLLTTPEAPRTVDTKTFVSLGEDFHAGGCAPHVREPVRGKWPLD